MVLSYHLFGIIGFISGQRSTCDPKKIRHAKHPFTICHHWECQKMPEVSRNWGMPNFETNQHKPIRGSFCGHHISERPPQPENLPILLSIRAKQSLSIVTNTLRLMNTLLGRVVLHRKKCYCFQLEMQLHCYLILKYIYLILDYIYLVLK